VSVSAFALSTNRGRLNNTPVLRQRPQHAYHVNVVVVLHQNWRDHLTHVLVDDLSRGKRMLIIGSITPDLAKLVTTNVCWCAARSRKRNVVPPQFKHNACIMLFDRAACSAKPMDVTRDFCSNRACGVACLARIPIFSNSTYTLYYSRTVL